MRGGSGLDDHCEVRGTGERGTERGGGSELSIVSRSLKHILKISVSIISLLYSESIRRIFVFFF